MLRKLLVPLFCAMLCLPVVARGDSFGQREAKFATGAGTAIYVTAGVLAPLLQDGQEHSLRTVDSLLTSTLITEGLKRVVRERRPRSPDERTSFPSGHATTAFAVATMQSHFHPRQSLLWYGGAALISASRVQLHRHYVHDVLGGAAVGYLTSRLELKQSRGLILAPFIKPRQQGGAGGVTLSLRF